MIRGHEITTLRAVPGRVTHIATLLYAAQRHAPLRTATQRNVLKKTAEARVVAVARSNVLWIPRVIDGGRAP